MTNVFGIRNINILYIKYPKCLSKKAGGDQGGVNDHDHHDDTILIIL